ncbi:MAG: hypothetical protein K0U93_04445 [Gammaproteobacteria bacterium]|nr:hypothetical protein [Gammaproteobacteria bacterium]
MRAATDVDGEYTLDSSYPVRRSAGQSVIYRGEGTLKKRCDDEKVLGYAGRRHRTVIRFANGVAPYSLSHPLTVPTPSD